MHETITYNELQRETARYIDKDVNLVVMAPTSSGKTIVAEQFLFTALNSKEKAIYLSPLKALTSEKLATWETLPYKIVAITSDHMRKPRPIVESLILMTTEALDSRSRGAKSWLKKVGALVVDEAHLLSSEGRGDATEIGITRFAQLNKKARIVFLSATITNAEELANWLTQLNGKQTVVVETTWRPVTQQHHYISASNREWEFDKNVLSVARGIIAAEPDKQLLLFVHTIRKGHTYSKALKCPFHYSRKPKEDRAKLEEAFRKKHIMQLVSTSTLAYGVNLPADIGIIAGAHRGPLAVDAQDIKQMAGRIGRYGLSTEGIIYYIFKEEQFDTMCHLLEHIPPVKSVLPRRLYFHIVSFVAREDMQESDIHTFINKTLAAIQYTTMSTEVADAIDMLLQLKILTRTGNQLIASALGRAAALMYVDPIDLWYLRKALSEKPITPTIIAKAFASVPSRAIPTYVPKDLTDPVEMQYGYQTLLATGLRDWLMGRELPPATIFVVNPFLADAERWLGALAIAGLPRAYLKSLGVMLINGVPETLLDLVELSGIGRKRAIALYSHGITRKHDIIKNERVAKNILGAAAYKKVKMQLDASEGKITFIF